MPGSSNIHQQGESKGNSTFNQIGRDQNNTYNNSFKFITKSSTQEVNCPHIPLPNLKISTYRNTSFIFAATCIFSAISSFLLLRLFYKFLPMTLFPLDFLILMCIIGGLSVYGVSKYLRAKKSDQLFIEYDDGKLTFKGRTYEFYRDIQDITYSANKSSASAELALLIINHQIDIPYHQTISFEYAARAEYIEKAFKDPERKKAYLQCITEKDN